MGDYVPKNWARYHLLECLRELQAAEQHLIPLGKVREAKLLREIRKELERYV